VEVHPQTDEVTSTRVGLDEDTETLTSPALRKNQLQLDYRVSTTSGKARSPRCNRRRLRRTKPACPL
jgi:hypothetical protein